MQIYLLPHHVSRSSVQWKKSSMHSVGKLNFLAFPKKLHTYEAELIDVKNNVNFHIGLHPMKSQLFEIRAVRFCAFFEILDFFQKHWQNHIQYVGRSNHMKSNRQKLQYLPWCLRLKKNCPNFYGPFLWNRSTKCIQSFVIEYFFET